MKVKIYLKDPDGIWDSLKVIEDEDLRDEVSIKFFKYGDYCTLEIDTDTMEAVVVKN